MSQAETAAESHPPKRSEPAKNKIHALTSLRFFAALWVVLYHSRWSEVPAMQHHDLGGKILSLGYVSVTFFFMLSGYILAMVYLRTERPLQRKKFFAARIARIYPLYVITLFADLPFLLILYMEKMSTAKASLRALGILAAHLLMLQAWDPHLRGLNFPSWSLSTEAFFYLIFPFVGILLWRLRGLSLWFVGFALWIGSQLLIFGLTPHLRDYAVGFNPLLHVPTFTLGIVLARWQTQRQRSHGASPRSGWSIWVALLCALAGIIATILWAPPAAHEYINHGLMDPVFALLIWALSENRSIAARVLSMRWLVILGEASFGLYLLQIPVLHVYQSLHWAESTILFPTYLAACIGLSVLSFYFVETPLRKWILNRLHSHARETMEAASDA